MELRSIERAAEPDALRGYAAELIGVVRTLAGTGVDAVRIGRTVSAFNDELTRALLALAEARLGPPPVPYAWMAAGSEGRIEQTLLTDQDNALAYAGDGDAAVSFYFEALAGMVVDGLLAAGFPPCPGGYMATRWRAPLDHWVARFRGWISVPDSAALVEASIFFDFRKVHGDLDLEPLGRRLESARGSGAFLARLAATVIGFRPPVGLFGRIRDKGTVDLKAQAVAPVVGLARLHGLEAKSRARSTGERLAAAASAGVLSHQRAENLIGAFGFVLGLRLRSQLEQLAAGRPLDNHLDLAALAPADRRDLRHALAVIRDALEGLDYRYQASRLR